MLTQCGSERSARVSKGGHDSSRMLRSLFLSLVAQVTMWFRWAAIDLAASSSAFSRGTGSSASGMPRAVLAITIASRSSVFASPADNLAAPWAAIPGR